jgi:hypothetical protein
LAAVSAAGFEVLTKRMAREIAGLENARERLFAMLRAYIDHGVENPALYSLVFGGYLGGPDRSRPSIELAEAEKTKALIAGVIVAGGLGHAIPYTYATSEKFPARFWLVGPSCMDSLCCWPMGSSARRKSLARWAIDSCRACSTDWRPNCRPCRLAPGSALKSPINSLAEGLRYGARISASLGIMRMAFSR